MVGNCKVCCEATNTLCAGCSSVHYCSKECQKRDWKNHKPSCHKLPQSTSTIATPVVVPASDNSYATPTLFPTASEYPVAVKFDHRNGRGLFATRDIPSKGVVLVELAAVQFTEAKDPKFAHLRHAMSMCRDPKNCTEASLKQREKASDNMRSLFPVDQKDPIIEKMWKLFYDKKTIE